MRSLVLQIPDDVYEEVRHTAAARGFGDLAAYIVDLIAHAEEDEPLSEASLQAIDQARAEIKAGLGLTPEQVRADLAANRQAWLQANPR